MLHGTVVADAAEGGAPHTVPAAVAASPVAAAGPERTVEAPQDVEAAGRRREVRSLQLRLLVGAVLTIPVFAVMADGLGAGWVPAVLLERWVQFAMIAPVMGWGGSAGRSTAPGGSRSPTSRPT